MKENWGLRRYDKVRGKTSLQFNAAAMRVGKKSDFFWGAQKHTWRMAHRAREEIVVVHI